MNPQLAALFYKEIIKLHEMEGFGDSDYIQGINGILNNLVNHITKQENMHFATQFARIAYVCHKYDVPQRTQWHLHEFRRTVNDILFKNKSPEQVHYQLGLRGTCDFIAAVFKIKIPKHIAAFLPPEGFYKKSPVVAKDYKPRARVVVLQIDTKEEYLLCQDEEVTDRKVKVKYNQTGINEHFSPTIEALQRTWRGRAVLNLSEVVIDGEGVYFPKVMVIEPDYLVDVSGIAYCFTPSGAHPLIYLLNKFKPFDTTKYLMLGNIANYFLDELMNDRDATFKETFPKVFRLNPLAFTVFGNQVVREIMAKSQKHFLNLKAMVRYHFQANDIDPRNCYLEPAFYSEQYGIQGRLDIFYDNQKNRQNSAIVELKSGKPFMANRYGINNSHYVQALLYDLMIKSAFSQHDPRNYILYSGIENDHLKFAPALKSRQHEAIQVRNNIVTIEQMLIQIKDRKTGGSTIIDKLRPSSLPNEKGFVQKDLEAFAKVWDNASKLEKDYFLAFVSFIAQEHQLAKIGVQGSERLNGLASLWLNSYKEKNDNFEIISHLKVKYGSNHVSEEEPIVTFLKDAELTNDLANFRVGDIAILYPCNEPENGETALSNQIFKGTIIAINKDEVTVRLRSRQFNDDIFKIKNQSWVIEHDMFDHSFTSMYKGLYSFLQYPERQRDLLFTKIPPTQPQARQLDFSKLPDIHTMTEEQQRILAKAINTEEYFLLWGPPGTGKTSIMLKNMVAYLLANTSENILLLAYTNRAVDEICDAIEDIGDFVKDEYTRIGSRYSTAGRFHEQLFDRKMAAVGTRKELKSVIDNHRIFMATVASISSRQLLLDLKKFDRVIIDEASQILEPVLVGLLPRFKRFILIGDHNQLPAVVSQDKESSVVKEEELKELGLLNLRDSLFERLYLRSKANQWTWAYDMLSYQGRMHQDIMTIPNEHFYDGQLSILPPHCNSQQDIPLSWTLPDNATFMESHLANHRINYINTPKDKQSTTGKTNEHEAQVIAKLVDSYVRLYENNGKEIDYTRTIGIITPYRAQIAKIKYELELYDKGYERFSVDTVERYQGSARDIILISLCINKPQQLDFLVSLSTDGKVDRKLNVALTRARKHLVLLGNQELMLESPVYRNIVEHIIKAGGKLEMMSVEEYIGV